MQKMIKRIAGLLTLLLFCYATPAFAWQIDDYQIAIDINQDSSLTVTENILADFSDKPKRGIVRNIPVLYNDESGRGLNVIFTLLGIFDENGNPWQYSESYSGAYMVLRIGSPYVTYNTQKMFTIKYRVTGALLFLEDHDELFWNAVGTEWDAPVNNVTVTVHLPVPVRKELLSTAAYTGRSGSRASTVETQIPDEQTITFTGGGYQPYEGVTVVVGWPKGIITAPPASSGTASVAGPISSRLYAEPYGSSLRGILMGLGWFLLLIQFIIPAVVFVIMFTLWKRYGKDPELLKSVVVEYRVPEALTPAEMGTLVDDRADMRDISATVVDLAVRGYIKIIKRDAFFFQKKFSFQLLKDFRTDQSLSAFEKTMLNGLFAAPSVGSTVALDDLENNFYLKLPAIRSGIYESLMRRGFYGRNPEKTVSFYMTIAIVLAFCAVASLVLVPLGIGLGLSAIIIICFAKYMPAKTRRGMDAYGKVLGFEEFLMRAEKDKIQYAERQDIFETMLPYALCLGISSQWAKIFDGLYTQPPGWFDSDMRDGFTMQVLMYDLSRSMSSMNQSLAATPRSVSSGGGFGGGGSSGGGFGGGGGSSW